MDHLFAPWRSAYIQRNRFKKGDCFLCKILKETKDEKNLILHRRKLSFIVMNLYPYNDGHLLVASHSHKPLPTDLPKEEWEDFSEACRHALKALTKALRPDGYNVGMNLGKVAGAGVADHLHLHVVPRWLGDTNFMPAVSETKMINRDLRKMYKKLKPSFYQQKPAGRRPDSRRGIR